MEMWLGRKCPSTGTQGQTDSVGDVSFLLNILYCGYYMVHILQTSGMSKLRLIVAFEWDS